MPSKQDFHLALQEFFRSGVAGAYGWRFRAAASAKKPCGKDLGIVQHQQVAGAKKLNYVTKSAVRKPRLALGRLPPQVQHSGARAVWKRHLGHQFAGQDVIKIRNQHYEILYPWSNQSGTHKRT